MTIFRTCSVAALAAHSNHPNPFNPSTTIAFDLPRPTSVTLSIHDARGALVRTLVDGMLTAAHHEVAWDGTDAAGRRLPSGIYHCRLVTPERVASRAMALVK